VDPDRPTPDLLLRAYRAGAFPMAEQDGPIRWYSPDPRAILPLGGLRIARSLRRKLKQQPFDLHSNRDFEAVMRACAAPRADRTDTWIDDRLVEAYVGLRERGHAHSVEAWLDGVLVGGLYGVQIGGAFFGESMFSRPELGGTDASKVCLVALVATLAAHDFTLLDTQFWTPHLGRFGCVEIPRADYLRRLAAALERNAQWPARLASPL